MHQQAREAWGVSHRTADRLVAAARAELIRGWHLERTEMLALSLARLDAVFRGAVASGIYNDAVALLDSRARLAML